MDHLRYFTRFNDYVSFQNLLKDTEISYVNFFPRLRKFSKTYVRKVKKTENAYSLFIDGGFFFFGYFGTFQYVMITSLDCVKNANPKVEHKNRSHASHTNHFLAYWQAYWHYTYKFLGVRRKGECLGVGCRFCPVLSLFTERDTTG